jgi:sporulation protein YlmC with PRC-barrel domain
MLRSLKDLARYTIQSLDGEVGGVKDLLFDDGSWKVRYVVAGTGSWLAGRRVLLSTAVFGEPNARSRLFPAEVTKSEIESSPSLDTDPPVSRQQEIDLHEHYRWLPYWRSPRPKEGEADPAARDPHLRGVRNVLGYRVHARDGEIGHVDDLIVDDADWTIRYLVVDTTNHWPGGEVLISPEWCDGFEWSGRKAIVNVPCHKVKDSPEYRPDQAVNRELEERLYDYHGRPRYWAK